MGTRNALLRLLAGVLLLFGIASMVHAETSRIEGQVVCSQCWFEADRSRVPYGSPGDLSCAARCSATGVPAAIAVRTDDSFELLLLDDPPAGADPWLEIVGRFVRVEGEVDRRDDGRVMSATTVELLDESPWADMVTAPADSPGSESLSWVDLSGHPFAIDGLRGRVVVLNFWATWCAPCRKEMPDLVRVQNRFGMLGVQVIGASADASDRSDEVMKFAREKKLNFPVLLGADTRQMESLGLGTALPGTVVLDREGRVVERFNGVFEPDALESAVERALSGADPHHEHAAHGDDSDHVHVASAATPGSLVPS